MRLITIGILIVILSFMGCGSDSDILDEPIQQSKGIEVFDVIAVKDELEPPHPIFGKDEYKYYIIIVNSGTTSGTIMEYEVKLKGNSSLYNQPIFSGKDLIGKIDSIAPGEEKHVYMGKSVGFNWLVDVDNNERNKSVELEVLDESGGIYKIFWTDQGIW